MNPPNYGNPQPNRLKKRSQILKKRQQQLQEHQRHLKSLGIKYKCDCRKRLGIYVEGDFPVALNADGAFHERCGAVVEEKKLDRIGGDAATDSVSDSVSPTINTTCVSCDDPDKKFTGIDDKNRESTRAVSQKRGKAKDSSTTTVVDHSEPNKGSGNFGCGERRIHSDYACFYCGLSPSDLKRCSRCKSAYYCASKQCQKSDWKVHKHDCYPRERREIDTSGLGVEHSGQLDLVTWRFGDSFFGCQATEEGGDDFRDFSMNCGEGLSLFYQFPDAHRWSCCGAHGSETRCFHHGKYSRPCKCTNCKNMVRTLRSKTAHNFGLVVNQFDSRSSRPGILEVD